MRSFSKKEGPDAPEMALRVFICILIVLAGTGVYVFFNKTKPRPRKVRPERLPPRVEIIKAGLESRQIVVSALGTIKPAREVEIKSTQGGEIVMVSPEFIPGGLFKKGEILLKIDPADYLLDIKRKESLYNAAKATLAIEMGHQDVAREELALMQITTGKTVKDSELALRKPQLDQARAQLETAGVNLEAARLNYKRTVVRAPFNGMVRSRSVNIGSQVSPQLSLGSFSGTDEYWVEASVPVSQLKWIDIPVTQEDKGSRVRVKTRYHSESGEGEYIGEVIRLSGSLSEKSRMAMVLIRVPDPLALKTALRKAPLIVGSYVSLEIQGKEADKIIPVPRKALRNNNKLWIFNKGRLAVRKIEAVWKGEAFIYVKKGISSGDAIIVSSLSGPVEGMRLTLQGESSRGPKLQSDK